uniref:Late blight resistance protein n=1 Tax=Solanum tuberosum TaxID=4113 RepID=M1DY80_SOLTU
MYMYVYVSAELRKPGQGFAWGQQWSPSAGPAQGVGSGRDKYDELVAALDRDAKQNLQKQVWCRPLRTPSIARKLTYGPSMSTVDPSGTAEEEPEPTRTKDEELRQQKVRESVAGASRSAPVVEVLPVVRDDVSTTDGAVKVTESTTESAMMDDVGTTEGDLSIVPAVPGEPDPPVC